VNDHFVAQLAELCRAERTRPKWVFVPSYAIGHTLGERLVLEGTDWANLRFTRPLDVALAMAAPFLVERGLEPAGDDVGPALLMRLLLDLPGDVPRYFRRLEEQPRLADALWATVRELRMAELHAADLKASAFASAVKHAELSALLARYEAHLTERRLADVADVYREALEHLDVGPVLAGDLRVELPDVVWAPLERRFLDALPGERLTPRTVAVPGLQRPRRLAHHVDERPPQALSDAQRLAWLMRPESAPPVSGDGTLTMFRAGGKEAEVDEVLRRIVHERLPLDHVEIACAQADYPALLWEKAQRYEIPITVGPGLPITVTRPGRALLAFCDWIDGGFAAGALRRLLQSGDVRLDIDGGPSAGQAARLLARSDATWGRLTYAAALTRLATASRERAADAESDDESRARLLERALHAEHLRAWIDAVLASVPDGARPRLGGVLDACVRFVREVAAKASELDGAAVVVLVESLDGLRALDELERPLRQALGLVCHQVDGLTVGADRARPGHLHVSALRTAGYAGRAHTFVLGLEEGRVLPAPLEDPVLLDSERVALDETLPTSRDRAGEVLHAVVTRLAALGGRVCLSFSCRDLRGHRETFPSWLLLQAQRLLEPGREWTYRELGERLGEPVSAVPSDPTRALGESGWWLAHVNGAGTAALPSVYAAFPWLVVGEAAEATRASTAFTAWDGHVPEGAALLDPRKSGRPVSATTLESLAACPFRHFLERGLGIEAIEDATPDPDRWLDPLTRGTLLHELYATILREARAAGQRVTPLQHGATLRALGEGALAAHRALVPPPSDGVFARERDEILRDLDLFLELCERDQAGEPIGFEVSFGGGPAQGEPLAQAEPVSIALAEDVRFLLRGRIDRIDRLRDGTYEVLDYKTGRYWAPSYAGRVQGGRLLQHALYGLAATTLLRRREAGARVSGSSYYFPTVRGQAERVRFTPMAPDRLAAVLRDLLDVLAAGTFVHTDDADDCSFCEMKAACGATAFERASGKLGDPALAAFGRLRAHE
jgi:hypothetical protein